MARGNPEVFVKKEGEKKGGGEKSRLLRKIGISALLKDIEEKRRSLIIFKKKLCKLTVLFLI